MKNIFNKENLEEGMVYFGWVFKDRVYGGFIKVDWWRDEDDLYSQFETELPISILETMKEAQ